MGNRCVEGNDIFFRADNNKKKHQNEIKGEW